LEQEHVLAAVDLPQLVSNDAKWIEKSLLAFSFLISANRPNEAIS